ncbi:hypothetical protein [Bacillus sp. PS06]|uniref:hypothetical protein n=1 Tax=Bacillus sp. PS06 TaxID=2764176 RepID=UPI001782B9F0|nr:hypothetical protein [Bacillus sp. PS06]MBD8067423.1 hypothetical protein [Bacillus sp. PS06]
MSSKLLLAISFLIILFNGFPSGYIIFLERLGTLYGNLLFIFTSLMGALFAFLIETNNKHAKFYVTFCIISNLIIACYPVFLQFSAKYLMPSLLKHVLFIF